MRSSAISLSLSFCVFHFFSGQANCSPQYDYTVTTAAATMAKPVHYHSLFCMEWEGCKKEEKEISLQI